MEQPSLGQSILIILFGSLTFVGLIIGLPYIVALFMPEYEFWVRDHIPELIGGLILVVMTGGIIWSERGQSNYQSGEDPLAIARIMVAFDSKRMAIRYLESIPRDHPKAAQVQMKIHELRQEI